MPEDDGVLLQWGESVALLVLDRPRAHNALDAQMLTALTAHCAALAQDPTLRAVVLTSAVPGTFCAGGDLREIAGLVAAGAADGACTVQEAGRRALAALTALPVPVLAAIDGTAFGGGAELALAADLRFAGPKARFALKQVAMGLSPAWGTTARLPRAIGAAAAMDLLLSTRTIDAAEMVRLGLALPAPREALASALAWVRSLEALPLTALRANLALLRSAYANEGSLVDAEQRTFEGLFGGAEHRAALDAFFTRRA